MTNMMIDSYSWLTIVIGHSVMAWVTATMPAFKIVPTIVYMLCRYFEIVFIQQIMI